MNKYHDHQYIEMLRKILNRGIDKGNRTGIHARSIFCHQLRFDLTNNSIPLLTTKKIHTNSIIHEIIWYLSGITNVKYLNDNGVKIWNDWADENGDLGPVYGAQWRAWPGDDGKPIDQVQNVIDTIKTNPCDRRMIISAWNVAQLSKMRLPPCHLLFQFYCNPYTAEKRREMLAKTYGDYYKTNNNDKIVMELCDNVGISKGELSCALTQRSCDSFIGVPYNIAQYSILTHIFAKITGYTAKEFIWTGNDVHIYSNHFDQVKEQLSREIRKYPSPTIKLSNKIKLIDDFKFNDIQIIGYQSQGFIKAPIAV